MFRFRLHWARAGRYRSWLMPAAPGSGWRTPWVQGIAELPMVAVGSVLRWSLLKGVQMPINADYVARFRSDLANAFAGRYWQLRALPAQSGRSVRGVLGYQPVADMLICTIHDHMRTIEATIRAPPLITLLIQWGGVTRGSVQNRLLPQSRILSPVRAVFCPPRAAATEIKGYHDGSVCSGSTVATVGIRTGRLISRANCEQDADRDRDR